MTDTLLGSPALAALYALQDRWAQVVDWVENSTNRAYEYRVTLNNQCMLIEDTKLRSSIRTATQQRFQDRLDEIDDVELRFKEAHDVVVSTLDHDALIERAVAILPSLHERARRESKEKLERELKRRMAHSKVKLPKGMMKNVSECDTGPTREEGAGGEGNDNMLGELPQTDRPQEASDT